MPFAGQGFIATAIGSILREQPIPIFGGGATVRDYIYVEDLAHGILAVLDHGQPGEAYNLGTGIGLSNMQVLAALEPIARVHGYDIQTEHHSARGFDVPVNVLNCNKVTAATGWQPRVSFADGMEQTWLAIADILAQPSNQPRSI
jgi:UDP-glucose 4-epimerase